MPLCFMQIDIDFYIQSLLGSGVRGGGDGMAVLRIFGMTEEGNSVLAHVHNFKSYFYVQVPAGYQPIRPNVEKFKKALNDICVKVDAKTEVVTAIEIHEKESIMYYTGEGSRPFFKVYCNNPRTISILRSAIERGVRVDNTIISGVTYESNLSFPLRYMVDTNISGMCWVELPALEYEVRADSLKVSHCQLEVDIDYTKVRGHEGLGEWSKIAPMRVLSFDIECNNNGDNFPVPEINEVIQIGTVCKDVGSDTVIARIIFTLGGCAEIADATVCSFKNEKEMLMAWRDFVEACDPDIITGYNILSFDFVYLWKRAAKLNAQWFPFFGRVRQNETRIKDTTFQSKAQGVRETKEVGMEGRIVLDMYQHIQKEHKLSQYTLNSVSLQFLKEQKEDVHWTIIRHLHADSDETRRRIAVYCLKDCYLPLRLLEKLMCVYAYTEMARVTGVPFSYLLTRGQQIKVASQLYRKARQHNMLIPTQGKSPDSGDKFEGAYVIEPILGYYTKPIATLDFASLYPSVMMAHNLCYCTLIPPHIAKRTPTTHMEITPSQDCFIKADVRKGLLPMILEELIEARKKAREELKRTTDPFTQKVLESRQLALKVSANSVYGFTGAQIGQLPCINISQSVTAYGRLMIETARNIVETTFLGSQVLYGDTDSVMVNFGVESMSDAMEMGTMAAKLVTERFPRPIKMEFEKVYCPYLLISKKRYAGLLWTNPYNYDKIEAKGIESVRRDNCALVRDSINVSLHLLLIQKDKDAAISYVKNTVSALLQNQIDMSLLVITKALGKRAQMEGTKSLKDYYKVKQAHVELAIKMSQRDRATAPTTGDRVAYVMVKGQKHQKAHELAEDPMYVLQNNLPLDFDYYLEKQLKNPIARIFEPIVPNIEALFSGEHTRKRYQPKASSGGLAKYIQAQRSCMNCKGQIKQGALCETCHAMAPEIVVNKAGQLNQAEALFQELWSECQRCQASYTQEVLCANRDCPIFYRREKVKKELGVVREELEKLQQEW